jgi:hypothetical protein
MRANLYHLENVLRRGWFHQGGMCGPLAEALLKSTHWFKHDLSLWESRPAGRRYIRTERNPNV